MRCHTSAALRSRISKTIHKQKMLLKILVMPSIHHRHRRQHSSLQMMTLLGTMPQTQLVMLMFLLLLARRDWRSRGQH